jgi:hypothetical protein
MWTWEDIDRLRQEGATDEEFQKLVKIAEHAIRAYERYINSNEVHTYTSAPPRWQIGWAMADDLKQALES